MSNIATYNWNRIKTGLEVNMRCCTVGCEGKSEGILGEEIDRNPSFIGEGQMWIKPDTKARFFKLVDSTHCPL